MTVEQIVPWLAAFATLASGANIIVSLYVRSVIGPIVTRLKAHEKLLDQRRESEREIWKDLRKLDVRLAHVEAKLN